MIQKLIIMLLWSAALVVTTPGVSASTVERYARVGAPALVFIPGLSSHGDLWRPWRAAYADSYDLYVVTAPGFAGVAPREGDAPFLKTTVTEIISELRAQGVKQATFVGHSIGGLMALMIAHDAPELVRKILVVDSLPYLAGLFMPGVTPDQAKARAAIMQQQMQSMPHDIFVAQQKQGLPRLTMTEAFLPTLAKWSETSDQGTVAVAFGETLGLDYRLNLSQITAPVTILVAYSKNMPLSRVQLQALYKAQYVGLQNKNIFMVEGSYHFIMIDQPDAFGRHLSKILE